MIDYLKLRLQERTTWAAIGAALVACLTLPYPQNLIALIGGVAGVLFPSPQSNQGDLK